MKNILYALAIVFTLNVAAQEGNERHEQHERREMKKEFLQKLTPEQIATLKTKKLTLALDLSEAQQQRILALTTAEAKQRKAKMEALQVKKEKGEKPTEAERYQHMNERLDAQIALKKEMKNILSKEQYEKWEKMQMHKKKGKKKMKRKHKAHKE
ncbi:hypothetical protein [Kordia zhangzhouensis]|uniref:hypothetical protein n=1 Tax=Kordia zhangzhouensis TaxID=1620405 RepID=UPI000629B8D7|nr:hypothetical protein [Kordia zhangzhouensis]